MPVSQRVPESANQYLLGTGERVPVPPKALEKFREYPLTQKSRRGDECSGWPRRGRYPWGTGLEVPVPPNKKKGTGFQYPVPLGFSEVSLSLHNLTDNGIIFL